MASLPETFEIEHASSSSSSTDATVDPLLHWNDLRTPPETLMLPQNDSFTFMNPNAVHEQRSTNNNSWSFGESSSSSSALFSNSELKSENGWPSSIGQGLRIEDQLYGPIPESNVFSLGSINMNPLCPQGSGSSLPALSINLGQDHSSSRGYVREGSSTDNRRMPCKRKSHEGAEVSEWHTHHSSIASGSSSSLPPFTEHIDPSLRLGLTRPAHAETSQTNFRLRLNNYSPSRNRVTPHFTTTPVSLSSLQSQGQSSLFHAPVPRNPVPNLNSPARNEACNPRNTEENPIFLPPQLELRALAENSVFPRNVGSSSASPAVPHLSQHHRRLFEHACRQGMSSGQQVSFPSGPSNLDHHHHRSAIRMERQANTNSVVGIPYSMQSGFPSEGRRRLASEIRSVLEMVRQVDTLRFEDWMMLDPSMFFGVAGIHDRHRDMRLDVDNMSYEELLALEDRIGNVGTGLNQETILIHMKQRKYMKSVNVEAKIEPCCICQEDYNDGEDIGTLDCGHDFHRDCVKQWLMQKNLCPICKTTALATGAAG